MSGVNALSSGVVAHILQFKGDSGVEHHIVEESPAAAAEGRGAAAGHRWSERLRAQAHLQRDKSRARDTRMRERERERDPRNVAQYVVIH